MSMQYSKRAFTVHVLTTIYGACVVVDGWDVYTIYPRHSLIARNTGKIDWLWVES